MHRKYFVLLVVITGCLSFHAGFGQTGSFTATVTATDTRFKPITISVNKPLFKMDDPHGYWFIHPRTASHHVALYPARGYGSADVAFIELNGNGNDFDVYSLTSDDSDNVTLKNQSFGITAPVWHSRDKETLKPMHIHFSIFTAGEIVFTISGFAQVTSLKGNSEDLGTANITGTGHFYRQSQYAQSAVLPGCNCDQTIYSGVFDPEGTTRTKSDCEAALRNRVFDIVQKSMMPLYTTVANSGNENKKAGDISISQLPGCVDINVPVNDRPYCSADFYHNGTAAMDAQRKYFTNDDGFGWRLIRLPSQEDLSMPVSTSNMQAVIQKQVAFVDSMQKLMTANKISADEFTKAVKAYSDQHPLAIDAPTKDYKKMEADYNLYVHVIINAADGGDSYLHLADRGATVVQHNIKGAAFEIFSPMKKDADGSWLSNRMGIYFGKFSVPEMNTRGDGFDMERTMAVYPANGNKLTIYNIIIKMEGGKDLMDKAIANIDFNALQSLMTKQ